MTTSEPRFEENEIVRVLYSPTKDRSGLVGLTGTVSGVYEDGRGGWTYSVDLPRRRHRSYSMRADEIESTGRMALPGPEAPPVSMKVQVDPDTGAGTLVDEEGAEVDLGGDQAGGLALFTFTTIIDPSAGEDDDPDEGVVVAKGRRPDGSWRYVVLLEPERVARAHDRHELDPSFWTDPEPFLDRGRPAGLEEVERAERARGVELVAAWHAPPPAFGYDQGVRVLDRPHTAAVAGRVGAVREEELGDDLRWRYWVRFDDDPGAEHDSATVDEADLEATGRYGDGYNPPPD